MFNKNRDTNFNPNDNPAQNKYIARWAMWTPLIHLFGIITAFLTLYVTVKLDMQARWVMLLPPTVIAIEAAMLRRQIGPRWIVMWGNAFRFRRDWFGIWTDTVTARTDHTTRLFGLAPLLGVIPSFDGSIVSFTLRPPKGQTLEFYTKFVDVLVAHSHAVEQIHIVYNKPGSKQGQLKAVFPQPKTTTTVVETLTEDQNEFA